MCTRASESGKLETIYQPILPTSVLLWLSARQRRSTRGSLRSSAVLAIQVTPRCPTPEP